MSKTPKYRNVKTVVDGITFDSKKEAKEYGVQKMRLLAKEIDHFDVQVKYPLKVNGQLICTYIADFVTLIIAGDKKQWEVIDVKSEITRKNPVYRLKKKLMLAILGITIIEK